MAFTILDPINRKILCQYSTLKDLLESSARHFEEEYAKADAQGDAQAKEQAEAASGGEHNEVYIDVYSQYCRGVQDHLADLLDTQNLFYHSMLSTAYAYLESICGLILKRKHLKKKKNNTTVFDAIFEDIGGSLSSEGQQRLIYLNTKIRLIRNLIVHNSNGTAKDSQVAIAKKESDKDIGFSYYEPDEIRVSRKYVEMVLDMSKELLTEIANLLGFVNQTIGADK